MCVMVWSGAATFARADSAPADSFEHRPIMRDAAVASSPQNVAVANPSTTTDWMRRACCWRWRGVGIDRGAEDGVAARFPGRDFAARDARHQNPLAIDRLSEATSPAHPGGQTTDCCGDSGAQLNPLCEITDGDEVAEILASVREETVTAARRFENLFGRARKAFDEDSSNVPTTEAPAEARLIPRMKSTDPRRKTAIPRCVRRATNWRPLRQGARAGAPTAARLIHRAKNSSTKFKNSDSALSFH